MLNAPNWSDLTEITPPHIHGNPGSETVLASNHLGAYKRHEIQTSTHYCHLALRFLSDRTLHLGSAEASKPPFEQ